MSGYTQPNLYLPLCLSVTWLVLKTQSFVCICEVLSLLPLSERGVARGLCLCQRHLGVRPQSCVGSWSSHRLTRWDRLPLTLPSEHWSARWMAPRRKRWSCLQCPRCWCPHRTTYHPAVRWQMKHRFDFISSSTSNTAGHKSALVPVLFRIRQRFMFGVLPVRVWRAVCSGCWWRQSRRCRTAVWGWSPGPWRTLRSAAAVFQGWSWSNPSGTWTAPSLWLLHPLQWSHSGNGLSTVSSFAGNVHRRAKLKRFYISCCKDRPINLAFQIRKLI